MSKFYCISTFNASPKHYKIGIHSGKVKELIKRYTTGTLTPQIDVHMFIETPHARSLESYIKDALKDYRLSNMNDNQSECLNCSLEIIQHRVFQYLAKHTIPIHEHILWFYEVEKDADISSQYKLNEHYIKGLCNIPSRDLTIMELRKYYIKALYNLLNPQHQLKYNDANSYEAIEARVRKWF